MLTAQVERHMLQRVNLGMHTGRTWHRRVEGTIHPLPSWGCQASTTTADMPCEPHMPCVTGANPQGLWHWGALALAEGEVMDQVSEEVRRTMLRGPAFALFVC